MSEQALSMVSGMAPLAFFNAAAWNFFLTVVHVNGHHQSGVRRTCRNAYSVLDDSKYKEIAIADIAIVNGVRLTGLVEEQTISAVAQTALVARTIVDYTHQHILFNDACARFRFALQFEPIQQVGAAYEEENRRYRPAQGSWAIDGIFWARSQFSPLNNRCVRILECFIEMVFRSITSYMAWLDIGDAIRFQDQEIQSRAKERILLNFKATWDCWNKIAARVQQGDKAEESPHKGFTRRLLAYFETLSNTYGKDALGYARQKVEEEAEKFGKRA